MIHLIRICECIPTTLRHRRTSAGDALTSGCDRLPHAPATRLVAGNLQARATVAEGDLTEILLLLTRHAHQEPLVADLPLRAAVAATAAIPAGAAGADGVDELVAATHPTTARLAASAGGSLGRARCTAPGRPAITGNAGESGAAGLGLVPFAGSTHLPALLRGSADR